MKNLILPLFALCLVTSTNAQETTFKPFKVDFAVGFALPATDGVDGGILFAIEPKYAVSDFITVGLKLESALTGSISSENDNVKAKIQARNIYQLTGDYFFNTNRFRPFVGAGAGILSIASINVNEGDEVTKISGGTKFVATPRVGFEFGHFRLAAEYNAAADKAGYFGIKLGFFAGGGRL